MVDGVPDCVLFMIMFLTNKSSYTVLLVIILVFIVLQCVFTQYLTYKGCSSSVHMLICSL